MRTDFADLPASVRAEVEEHTGTVRKARTADAGINGAVAAFLDTEDGPVFLKGTRDHYPEAGGQAREAAVNPYIRGIGPRMLWREKTGGWDLAAFEVIEGAHHANYAPDSPDLPKLAVTLGALAELPCPPVPILGASRRWAPYVDDMRDQRLLSGHYLLHTDPNPTNVLVTDDRAWLVDWAWATRGAGFIDLGCLLPRLIDAGHSPDEAEAWAEKQPVWQEADPDHITLFAKAVYRMWQDFADRNPAQSWRWPMVQAAATWSAHRARSR